MLMPFAEDCANQSAGLTSMYTKVTSEGTLTLRKLPMTVCQSIPEENRRQIFHALVAAQDRSMTVSESRQHIAQQFSVTEFQVRQIEREGLNSSWPPL
jgi:hypothetical protein